VAADPNALAEPLRSAVLAVLEESGGSVTVSSAFRTQAEQAALRRQNCGGTDYDIWERPASECNPATAKPGESQHERGLAVDFGGDLDLAAKLGAKHGLVRTVPKEPWHFEHRDALGSGATIGAGADGIRPVEADVGLGGVLRDRLGDAGAAVVSVPAATLELLRRVLDPTTWLRLTGALAGGTLVVVGLVLISRDLAPGATAAITGAARNVPAAITGAARNVPAARAAGAGAVNPATPPNA